MKEQTARSRGIAPAERSVVPALSVLTLGVQVRRGVASSPDRLSHQLRPSPSRQQASPFTTVVASCPWLCHAAYTVPHGCLSQHLCNPPGLLLSFALSSELRSVRSSLVQPWNPSVFILHLAFPEQAPNLLGGSMASPLLWLTDSLCTGELSPW